MQQVRIRQSRCIVMLLNSLQPVLATYPSAALNAGVEAKLNLSPFPKKVMQPSREKQVAQEGGDDSAKTNALRDFHFDRDAFFPIAELSLDYRVPPAELQGDVSISGR